jgi:hypothetical protein
MSGSVSPAVYVYYSGKSAVVHNVGTGWGVNAQVQMLLAVFTK